MPVLSPQEITHALNSLHGWKLKDGAIVQQFSFADFAESMSFVNAVAVLAEHAEHHPDIDIRYSKVELALASHDAGGITEKDIGLARAIGEIH